MRTRRGLRQIKEDRESEAEGGKRVSSALLEERQERERNEAVARALGISVDDLDKLDWTLDADASDDGVLYAYTVNFGESSDPEVLSRIKGLQHGRWARIDDIDP
jgi:hypothetical protein